jgi:hypothetical protein
MNFRALMLGVVLGVGASFVSCGPATACSASSCPSGCCDLAGACHPSTADTCGLGGAVCSACQSGQTCALGVCKSGATGGGAGGGVTGGGTGGGATGGGTGGGTTGGGGGNHPVTVVINEIAGVGQDFVELYNPGTAAVDLSSWSLTDMDKNDAGPKVADAVTLPSGTLLSPGAFLLLVLERKDAGVGATTDCPGSLPACFQAGWGISNSKGETIFVLDTQGGIAAQQHYPGAQDAGESYARLPDGTGAFDIAAPTPGASNHQ